MGENEHKKRQKFILVTNQKSEGPLSKKPENGTGHKVKFNSTLNKLKKKVRLTSLPHQKKVIPQKVRELDCWPSQVLDKIQTRICLRE